MYSDLIHRGMQMLWVRDNMLQVVFPSIGCQKVPHCKMCNFGQEERNCVTEEAIHILDRGLIFFANTHKDYSTLFHLNKRSEEPKKGFILLLNTFGSILDKRECPYLEDVFHYLAGQTHIYKISRIILETHLRTIDVQRLIRLSQILDCLGENKPEICIEVGIESANQKLLREVLHKDIDLGMFVYVSEQLRECGFKVIANVLLGVPTLSPRDQISDCIETIMWIYNYAGADEVTLFPLNLWEGSPLWTDYLTGYYNRPSYYQLLEVLAAVPEIYLENLYLSWYGDRQLKDPGWNIKQKVLTPDCGGESLATWVTFCERFMLCEGGVDKHNLAVGFKKVLSSQYFEQRFKKSESQTITPKAGVVYEDDILRVGRLNANMSVISSEAIQKILDESGDTE